MKRYPNLSIVAASLALLTFIAPAAKAQTLDGANEKWHESSVNSLTNIRYYSTNPVRISYNAVKDYGVALTDYGLGSGDYHAKDKSGDVSDISVYLGGLRNVGKVSLSGYLRYDNLNEDARRWNSTTDLWADNPFIVADSVASDVKTESFDMQAVAAYDFSGRLKGGASIGLKTSTLSDQTDPRPKTNLSIIPVNVGVEYVVNDNWNVGLTAGIRLMKEDISYTRVNTLIDYTYFLMKGMGDFYKRTTADGSINRDYKGTVYSAALQTVYTSSDNKISDLLELSFQTGNEDAIDGGSSFTFRGGDFSITGFGLNNRFLIRGDKALHNIILSAKYSTGGVTWYDQRRVVDTEHGNRVDYQILSKNTIQDNTTYSLDAEYRIDLLKNNQRDLYVDARVGTYGYTYKHYTGTGNIQQKTSLLNLGLTAGKAFRIRKADLEATLGGGYVLPLSETFGSGSTVAADDNIEYAYTRPQFEYASSAHANVNGKLDASLPVSEKLRLGLYAKASCNIYAGDNKYWNGFDGTSYTAANFGVYLRF